jgi:hypothetical protein
MGNRILFAVALLAGLAAPHRSQAQCQLMSNGQCVGSCRNGVCVMIGESCGCPPVRARESAEIRSGHQLANLIRPNVNRQKTCRKQDATPIEFGCK